jgi:hypothetical protein
LLLPPTMAWYAAEAADEDPPAPPSDPPPRTKRRGRPPIELTLSLIMPSQFFPENGDGPAAGEKRLMFAVLREALGVLLKYAAAQHGQGRRLFLEAKRWITSNNAEWPCSFVNICETLGLDPACVRRRLARCQAPDKSTASSDGSSAGHRRHG